MIRILNGALENNTINQSEIENLEQLTFDFPENLLMLQQSQERHTLIAIFSVNNIKNLEVMYSE